MSESYGVMMKGAVGDNSRVTKRSLNEKTTGGKNGQIRVSLGIA